MDKKLNFTPEELLNHKFGNSPQGYTPIEVDRFFDKIIADYKTMLESNSNGVDLSKFAKELEDLKRENQELRSELEKERNKWKYISKDHKDIHIDNYELLLRIGKLEMFINEKLNINPGEIK